MGLLQRREDNLTVSRLYTLPGQEKRLVVGLGNPGDEYELTRHNAGFLAVDQLADEVGVGWTAKKDLKSLVALTVINGKEVVLVKPQTFMNDSGQAVRAVMDFYKSAVKDVIVIHDELDLPFSGVKRKIGGGSAGHNGIKSVISHLGEEFGRIRIGVGPKTPPQIDSADYVLQSFSATEQKKLPDILKSVITEVVNSL